MKKRDRNMVIDFVKKLLVVIPVLLLQVLALNRIHLFGYATPFFFIYLILISDVKTNPAERMLWAFFMGLITDVYSNTPGMHAASATLLAAIQPWLLGLFISLDKREQFVPGVETMNTRQFFLYLTTGTLVHHIAYFLLKTFSFQDWSALLLRIVVSAVLTMLLMIASEYIFRVKRRRRR